MTYMSEVAFCNNYSALPSCLTYCMDITVDL